MATRPLKVNLDAAGKPITVRCEDDAPIADVIRQLVESRKLPKKAYEMRFVKEGRTTILDPAQTLRHQGIPRGAMLHLVDGSIKLEANTDALRATAKAVISTVNEQLLGSGTPVEQHLAHEEPLDADALREIVVNLRGRIDPNDRATMQALDDLSEALGRRKPVRRARKKNPPNCDLLQSFDGIRALLQQAISVPPAVKGPNVRIRYEDLELTYVPSETLTYMEDYQSETQKWGSYALVCLSTVFSFVVNWMTPANPEISPMSVAAVIIFTVTGCFAFFSARRAQDRLDEFKGRLRASKKPRGGRKAKRRRVTRTRRG